MSQLDNPYAPPASADVAPAEKTSTWGQYYAVPPLKMVLLSFATFGLYEIYWFFKQWKAVREQTHERLSPVARSLFAIFFCNRLFGHIRGAAINAEVRTGMATGALSAIFILGSIFESVASRAEWGPAWMLGFVTIVPLAIMQKEVNQLVARQTPDADRNTRYGAGVIVLLVIGALLWGLVILGTLVETPGAAR
jgi:Domain of unknown function (DUF4234)